MPSRNLRRAVPLAFALTLGAAVPALVAAPALAQSSSASSASNSDQASQAKPERLRGTIKSLDGSKLAVDSRDNGSVTVDLASDAKIMAVEKAALSDIKKGDFVGVASVPDSGNDSAVEVLIFPKAMAGTGEGSYPWDLKPNSTMTNATVSNAVTGTDVADKKITLKYPQGEKTISLPDGIPVVTLADASTSDLTEGTRVFVPAKKTGDHLQAGFVVVGKDGVVPPM